MKKLNNILAIMILILLLLVLYVASYWLDVRHNGTKSLMGHFEEGQKLQAWPSYRCGGTLAETIYSPLQAVDRRIRPEYWTWTYHTNWFSRATIFGP